MTMNKVGIVISREYLSKVRSKSFILVTLLTPIFIVAIILLPALLMRAKSPTATEKTVFVKDNTGEYFQYLSNVDGFKFVESSSSLAEIREDLPSTFYGYMTIEDNLVSNPKAITIFTEKQTTSELSDIVKNQLTPIVRSQKIATYNIPNLEKILDDTKVRLDISTVKWQKDTDEVVSSSSTLALIVSQIANFLIYLFILSYGSAVFASVREEKKSRIVEIIVSSVKPFELLLGKIIAVAMVGFTQILVWGIMIFVAVVILQFTFFDTFSFSTEQLAIASTTVKDVEMANMLLEEVFIPLQSINFSLIIICFIFYFIGGYLLFSSIYAAFGAAVDNDEDSNQLMMPVTLFFILAFYLGFFSANNPDNTVSVIASLFPFTSPIVMMVRLPYDPPMWEIITSIALLWITAFGCLWVASRIYRVGILMYGKKPSFKTMMQWVKYK